MKSIYNKNKAKKFFFIIILLMIFFLILLINNNKYSNKLYKKKRVGIVGLAHSNNIGNNLVKFSIYTKLKEFGFNSEIIGFPLKNSNLYFLKKYVQLKSLIANYSELNEKNYDYLIVNSDQTWNGNCINRILNYGFLKFAKNWKTKRFVYGASLGHDYWRFDKIFDKKAKLLLKDFSGISVREKNAVKLVQDHLGIKPEYVLDPTMLIDKNYYLDLIKDFKLKFNYKNKYLCVYKLDKNSKLEKFIKRISEEFNYKIYQNNFHNKNYIENFIFSINISEAVITDSFHGTIFSIIFNKSFITFINSHRGRGRFTSLIETFHLEDRIIDSNKNFNIDINLIKRPLNLNQTLISSLRNNSINFLKKNLEII